MGWYSRGLAAVGTCSLGSLTTTAANETARIASPSGRNVALIQGKNLTERIAPAEIWVPLGIWYVITTGITVTAAVVTLRKNGVNAASGGTITLPIAALGANYIYAPFTGAWTFNAPDAAGDQWSFIVTTTSTAGVVNPVLLEYAVRSVVGVTEAVSQ